MNDGSTTRVVLEVDEKSATRSGASGSVEYNGTVHPIRDIRRQASEPLLKYLEVRFLQRAALLVVCQYSPGILRITSGFMHHYFTASERQCASFARFVLDLDVPIES